MVKPNRLANEKSPYLLQHAHNPVDWYPWGEEAFRRAKEEDRPIFLSIGYSSCHWCHVMERECFEDEEVASLMNRSFVNIKVDREERPDIDDLYMKVCQMMTGGGGWPLTIIMGPDRRPFYAATFIPKSGRGGTMGLMDLVPTVIKVWQERRGEVEKVAEQVTASLKGRAEMRPASLGEKDLAKTRIRSSSPPMRNGSVVSRCPLSSLPRTSSCCCSAMASGGRTKKHWTWPSGP